VTGFVDGDLPRTKDALAVLSSATGTAEALEAFTSRGNATGSEEAAQ
jgi:hypothetical protein